MSMNLENMILSKSVVLKERVASVPLSKKEDVETINLVLSELDYFLAYLGNERLAVNQKCIEISNSLPKNEFLKYSLKYILELEKDLGDLNV